MNEPQEHAGHEFRHFNGKRYRLEGFAKGSETPKEIKRDGKTMMRFELLEDGK